MSDATKRATTLADAIFKQAEAVAAEEITALVADVEHGRI